MANDNRHRLRWPQVYFPIDHQSQSSPSTHHPNLFLMLRRHGAELLSLWWLYLVYVGAPRTDSCHAGEIGCTRKSAGGRAVNEHQRARHFAVALCSVGSGHCRCGHLDQVQQNSNTLSGKKNETWTNSKNNLCRKLLMWLWFRSVF